MRTGRTGGPRWMALVGVAAVAAVGAGCTGPVLANPPQSFPSPQTAPTAPPQPPDPIPLAFPRDDGPHGRLTEWWYYTGHLRTPEGRRFGFEAVIFRALRSTVPTAWASHLALTDEANDRFLYAQRSEVGPQVDHSPRAASGEPTDGFDLRVSGLNPLLVAAGGPAVAPEPWRLAGSDGVDRITAALTPEEAAGTGAAFGLDLAVDGSSVVPHDDDGFVDFGPAGTSYYYSRMRGAVDGTLMLDGERLEVEGTAWFDHQWGDFISVGGGWDWFAINLADGTDITLSVVLDASGTPALLYGTQVERGSAPVRLDARDFTVETLGSWTSASTGRTWPSGWRITIGEELVIGLDPTVDDQELDTRPTTGVVYWEGSQVVQATRDGEPVAGEAYVEITRYED